MKHLLLSALLAIAVTAGAFASGETNVNDLILRNFSLDFKQAKNVIWISKPDYSKVSFTLENQNFEVFYNNNGEKIATSRHITMEELPIRAKRVFAKRYTGYNVVEVIKFDGTEETAFYLSAENDKEKIIFKIDLNDQLSIFNKSAKKN